MKTIGKIISAISSVIFSILGALFSYDYYIRSKFPYNELGRYYDGEVVWQEQAVDVVKVIAIFCILMAVASIFVYASLKKQPQK